MKRAIILLFGLVSTIILFGCSNEDATVKEMKRHIEKVSSLEKNIYKKQEPVADMERIETAILNEILALTKKEQHTKDIKIKLAVESAKKRKFLYQRQEEEIASIELELEELTKTREELKDGTVKELAFEVIQLLKDRKINLELAKIDYVAAIDMEISLYENLNNEEATAKELTDKLLKIKQKYDNVLLQQTKFNESSIKVKEKRNEFFEAAGFKISSIGEENK